MKTSADACPAGGAGMRQGAVLFTTCDLADGRQHDLLRLLDSVGTASRAGKLPIRHYILLQRAARGVPPALVSATGPSVQMLAIAGRVSLSRARNLLLRCAHQDGALASALWVGFPDDDAWYPPLLPAEVSALFAASASLTLVTCRYGSQPLSLVSGEGAAAFRRVRRYRELIGTVSSNTMMLRASAVEETGGFDERLGVGARLNGGEDLDYALRVLTAGSGARHAILSPHVLVGHRDRLQWVRSRYFAGSLFALARAARCRPSLSAQVLRKLLVGVSLVALREMTVADLCTGLLSGLSGWFEPEPEIGPAEPRPVPIHAASISRP